MGKFIKTTNLQIMPDFVASNVNSSINQNPYYIFNNVSQFTCTYYNINTTMTTLDESTRGNYGDISPESPIRFNKINNFAIYGFNKIEPSLEIGEFGLENSDVNGDIVILPNTIIPYPGDFFVLKQINKPYLFRVTSTNPNTIDTGAITYRVTYTLASSDGLKDIEAQVVKEFDFSIENYGSNFGCLIESSTKSFISEIERYTTMMKDYYIQLFYDTKIQSFAYLRGPIKVYDAYLVQFLINNSILKGSTNYMFVQQQVFLPSTFGIEYDRTFMSALEDKNYNKHYCKCAGNLYLCTQKLSLLYAYPQDYYTMEYKSINSKLHIIDIFNDPKFMEKIRNNEKTNNILKNIIIGYFNNESITKEILEELSHIDFMQNEELYYLIPFCIYCMEQYIISLL